MRRLYLFSVGESVHKVTLKMVAGIILIFIGIMIENFGTYIFERLKGKHRPCDICHWVYVSLNWIIPSSPLPLNHHSHDSQAISPYMEKCITLSLPGD